VFIFWHSWCNQWLLRRGTNRHKSIAPKIYSNRDTSVTHPLPLFEMNAMLGGSNGPVSSMLASSSSSNKSSSNNRIMSRVETFSSDHRQIANAAMDAMYKITR
jgi:hypothetical protein